MELFETKKNFIFVNGLVALFCDRLSGHLSFYEADKVSDEWNPVCLGYVKGLIGKIKIFPDGESKLMLINQVEKVGEVPLLGPVYKITKVTNLSLNTMPATNLDIDLCVKHHFGIKKTDRITTSPENQKHLLRSIHEQVKKTAESVKPKSKDTREREKFEKRMLDEYDKMFQEGGDCFYVSYTNVKHSKYLKTAVRRSTLKLSTGLSHFDITNNVLVQKRSDYKPLQPLWRRANENYFWNKSMLQEAIDSAEQMLIKRFGKSVFDMITVNEENYEQMLAQTMIYQIEEMLMPIIQGYVDVQPYLLSVPSFSPINRNLPTLPSNFNKHKYVIHVALISRRNRHRAGTRYRRRGVDENGFVANYVETEQILKVDNDKSPHIVSFVQVRGSVPVFWTQTSLKYRPPIILEKSDTENQTAFQKHLNEELKNYDKVVILNLVDTTKEKPERKIADAYLEQLVTMNSPKITCVMFDFHDYCKGLQFDNVSILIKGITEIFRDMKYTWVDRNGLICEQKSVFRVNCVDCLDRTNVVQCMSAGVVVETQMRKLGLLSPEESLPLEFFQIMQTMWANNGDAISRQYSGTAAMKGDFTRTGTRTMNGMVKDGMSSVNRYYLRLRELSRQAAIDLMTGEDSSAEVINLRSGRSDQEHKLIKQKEINIKELTLQCKLACLTNEAECYAESILIMCNENERDTQDMNTVALVTSKMIYFISNLLLLPENRIDYQQKRQPFALAIPLNIITKVQMGYDSVLFRSRQPMFRIHYDISKLTNDNALDLEYLTEHEKTNNLTENSESRSHIQIDVPQTYYLAFKQPSLRLFNNMLVEVKKNEEQQESLRAIAESFFIAAQNINNDVIFDDSFGKFEKVRGELIPEELFIPIDVGLLYENVMLITTLGNLNADEMEDDDEIDDVVVVDDLSKPTSAVSNIESIKQGIRNVKDKMNLRDWRERLSMSPRTATSIPVNTDGTSNIDTFRSTTDDILSTPQEKDLTKHIDANMMKNQKKKKEITLKETRERLGSNSDDENTRRKSRTPDQSSSLKKSLSVIVKFNENHLNTFHYNSDSCSVSNLVDSASNTRESVGGTSCCPSASPSHKRKQMQIYKNKHFESNSIREADDTNMDRRRSSMVQSNRQLSDDNIESSTKIKGVNKKKKKICFLRSCGFLFSSDTSQSENPSIHSKSAVQLTAVTGDAYQRRAERISLQLSVDDQNIPERVVTLLPPPNSKSPPKDDKDNAFCGFLTSNKSPTNSPREERLKQRLMTHKVEYKEKLIEQEKQRVINGKKVDDYVMWNDDETKFQDIDENLVDNQPPMELLSRNTSKEEVQKMLQYIQLPPIEIRNIKTVDRLVAKQINLVLFVENLRKRIHGESGGLLTSMIIF